MAYNYLIRANKNQLPEQENKSITKLNTNFEDLSNEIIYEIFEFLDTYHIYEIVRNLNLRFRNLLISSNFPVKINITNLSKSSFQQYYQQFLKYNTYRISSLFIFNSFIVNTIFSSYENIRIFTRLETLHLENIDLINDEHLLDNLALLTNLSSLTINSLNDSCDKNIFYMKIFRLPALKYCHITLADIQMRSVLPIAHEKFSLIEHFIIDHDVYLNELIPLLSYVPNLHRLSIKCLVPPYNRRPETFSIDVNNLTHVSLKLKHINFDQLELFIRNLFHHIQVLHLSTSHDNEYLNAKRWERTIACHMPYLRIFDMQHKKFLINNEINRTSCQILMDSFATLFWSERKWFFTHQHNYLGRSNRGIFYSARPYRRRSYTLNCSKNPCNYPCHTENSLRSVRHIYIENESIINNSSIYFPNANELTISIDDYISDDLMMRTIGDIIPLAKLTKITINIYQTSLVNIIKMLYLTPNCYKLMINSISMNEIDILSLENSGNFRLLSNVNRITDVIIKSCTLEEVRLLVHLCPQWQNLTLSVLQEEFQSIIKYLLMNNENNRYLHSLYIRSTGDIWIEKLINTIEEVKQHDEVSVKVDGYFNCHLWW